MIYAAIVGAEVAFWVFLLAGLAARYVLRRPRLGAVLLLGSPVADAALLGLAAMDLHGGADPTTAHGLAAVYLGFTVVFGRSLVRWVDQRFAHRFAGGPPPVKPPRRGHAKVGHEWREFRKAALAWGISAAVLGLLTLVVGDLDRAQPLLGYLGLLSLVLVIWFVTGPVPAVVANGRLAGRSGR